MPAKPGRPIAITGATGFIGRRLLPALAGAGWRPRILVRRDPAGLAWGDLDIDVVQGDVTDAASVRKLIAGVESVVHLAGRIKAPDRHSFMNANVQGTRVVCEAAACAGVPALVVSSLAARQPQLSDYAASKRAAEEVAIAILGERVSVLRPPAVYGPGDRETLIFFVLAGLPWVPLLGPVEARNALIHVDDLCSLMIAMLGRPPSGRIEAASDASPEGYSWRRIMQTACRAGDRRPHGYVQLPGSLVKGLGVVGDVGRLLGQATMFNSGKRRELLFHDWAVTAGERVQPSGWAPRYDLETGFADSVRDYRARGWL